jgi:uncharacterized SAM-binding protein YcdF (DUF218 family)
VDIPKLLFTLIAIAIGVGLVWRGARRAVTAIGALVLWLIGSGWLCWPMLAVVQAGAPSVTTPIMGKRTAIVVLGAGTVFKPPNHRLVPPRDALARLETAAALYRRCVEAGGACIVILSGGNPQRHADNEAHNYYPYLLSDGVPAEAVLLETHSYNTRENALFSSRLIKAQNIDTTLLVTSAYQIRRGLAYFDYFGVTVQPVVANQRSVQLSWHPVWRNYRLAELALHESAGLVQFYLYRELGLLKTPSGNAPI